MRRERMTARCAEMWAKAAPPDGARGLRVAPRAAAGGATEIFLYDEIGPWGVTAADFNRALAGVEGDVLLRVNSPGGDAFDGMAIHNALRAHATGKVTARVEGIAASAATFIALAAERVEMARPSMWMIHNAWGLVIGNKGDMLETAALLEKIDGQMRDLYAARTGGDPAEIAAWMDAETYFDADEAVANGFAAAVYEPPKRGEPEARGAASFGARARMRLRLAASAA